MAKKAATKKTVETITHADAKRKNIPTAEYQSVLKQEQQAPTKVKYPRNTDLDPQLVWRGKDEQDWSDLVVHAPPIYIQEKVHPKVLIDDLLRQTEEAEAKQKPQQYSLFGDFNGMPEGADKTDFYQHDSNWTNRMILGDSLQVMASLAEREGLRGKVQCIYFDPPYGIKFNSNFQWSTTSRDVKDGNAQHITREPEQVKAFRDTWRDGIHSYLTYLRDRLTVMRDLLTDSGSIFVQISNENYHRITALMDEVFGDTNRCTTILMKKSGWSSTSGLPQVHDFVVWYAKDFEKLKYRQLYRTKAEEDFGEISGAWVENQEGVVSRPLNAEERKDARSREQGWKLFVHDNLTSTGPSANASGSFEFQGVTFWPGVGGRVDRHWKTITAKLPTLVKANRLMAVGSSLRQKRYLDDFSVTPIADHWNDTAVSGFADTKIYVVQTNIKALERCLLMATDPGDLVLDPTCGSGTTAYVAEQWGRRWITIDTSRVALALARARIMGARYPFYLLADSKDGQQKEAEVTRSIPSSQPVHNSIRQGFVYERVPHITLKSIANNAEIDVIWEKWQVKLEPLRDSLNKALKTQWQEWEIPREAEEKWSKEAKTLHADWWKARIARQKEIDASIAAKAEYEYLYDKPYTDNKKVRVAGPFTVESLSPHRMLGVDENDDLIDPLKKVPAENQSFDQMVLENLRVAGVQQAHKEDRISFTALAPWPGKYISAEGRYSEGSEEKRAAIFIGPEFGTVQRQDLVLAAREAADAGFDTVIACAFNYEAHTTEFTKLGRVPVLKARMNADLHMSDELKNTGKGNLFVIFGEPDIDLITEKNGQLRVKVNGVDVFKPQSGEVVSSNTDGIACWFIDSDYNEESFFVRHAYFLGASDPYKSLKTTLKAEINEEAWETLRSDTSRPFDKPKKGRIAVKVINHLGDEVMKVFKV